MIKCPVCSLRNPDANERCFKCSALLARNDDVLREATRNADRKLRRTMQGGILRRWADRVMHTPWVRGMFAVPEDGRYRYPFTAGLLSLVLPGTGHLYVGQKPKAVILMVCGVVLLVIAVVTLRAEWSNWLLLGMLVVWLVVWADSVAVTQQSNGRPWRFRKTLALMFGAMMIVGFSVMVLQFLGSKFISLQKVGGGGMPPAFYGGDRIAFDHVSYWVRKPRVGEIAYYDPPRFVATTGQDIYSINVRRYYQRIIGGPGDTVAYRGGKFFRNGVELGPDEIPLNGADLPEFEVVVPEESYFIPVTTIPRDALAGLVGAAAVPYVGHPDFVFQDWPKFAIVPEDDIRARGMAIINPPQRRSWL